MKNFVVKSLFCATTLFVSALAFAQTPVDSLFYRDGRVEGVTISKSTNELLQFSYPNESLVNEIQKTDLVQIKYRSGRIENLSTIEDLLPIPEPEFVGEVYLVKDNNEYALLDKETGELKSGTSFKANSTSATSLYVNGKTASLCVSPGEIKFIVRGVDNASDPMGVITIYKFSSSSKKRSVLLSRNNSDNMLNSKTYGKYKMKLTGEKYGRNSYLVATTLEAGEYGITVANSNNIDEKSLIISCISVGE